MQERVLKQKDVIFREGSIGNCMYKIIDGTVSVVLSYGTKEERKLAELGEGRIVGEMGLIEKLPRSATAVVLENDTVLTRLTEKDLDRMAAERPAFILLALQHISSRLRRLTKDYIKACATIARMNEEEQEGNVLSEEEEELINYYTALAQAQNNQWMVY